MGESGRVKFITTNEYPLGQIEADCHWVYYFINIFMLTAAQTMRPQQREGLKRDELIPFNVLTHNRSTNMPKEDLFREDACL